MSHKKDRYRFNEFYQGEGSGIGYSAAQRIPENIFQTKALKIVTLAMDFIGATKKYMVRMVQVNKKMLNTKGEVLTLPLMG